MDQRDDIDKLDRQALERTANIESVVDLRFGMNLAEAAKPIRQSPPPHTTSAGVREDAVGDTDLCDVHVDVANAPATLPLAG